MTDTGACHYTHLVINKVQEGLLYVDNQIETNFPTQRQAIIEFSEPYVELSKDFGRIFGNIFANIKEVVIEKYPVVIKSVSA